MRFRPLLTTLAPVHSLESTSVKTMQLVAGMTEKAHVTIPELPSVPKTHDDKFLRCEPSLKLTHANHSQSMPSGTTVGARGPPMQYNGFLFFGIIEPVVCSQSCQPLHRRARLRVRPALSGNVHCTCALRSRQHQGLCLQGVPSARPAPRLPGGQGLSATEAKVPSMFSLLLGKLPPPLTLCLLVPLVGTDLCVPAHPHPLRRTTCTYW